MLLQNLLHCVFSKIVNNVICFEANVGIKNRQLSFQFEVKCHPLLKTRLVFEFFNNDQMS